MFWLSKAEEQSRTIITVDGQLSVETIEVIESCCDQAVPNGKPVHLFLRDVSTVDQAGRTLLCRLAARGVRLFGSGVYTSYLVQTANPPKTQLNSSIAAGRPARDAKRRKP
jgi:ABC-type transporter Mla MlaB component